MHLAFHILKNIHIACIVLTFFSFSLRGFWMVTDSPLLRKKMVKIVPHIIDTILLISGFAMAFSLYEAFYKEAWLVIKISALVVYIFLGSFALKYGRTKLARMVAFFSAWGVFFFMVIIAKYHTAVNL